MSTPSLYGVDMTVYVVHILPILYWIFKKDVANPCTIIGSHYAMLFHCLQLPEYIQGVYRCVVFCLRNSEILNFKVTFTII